VKKYQFLFIIAKAKICHFVIYETTGPKLTKFLHNIEYHRCYKAAHPYCDIPIYFAMPVHEYRSLGNFAPKLVAVATSLKGSEKGQIYNP